MADLAGQQMGWLKGRAPVRSVLRNNVSSLAEFLEIVHPPPSPVSPDRVYWFRGHSDIRWKLTPGALRHEAVEKRQRALALLGDFRRLVVTKLPTPPPVSPIEWLGLAQHYGLQTRLLDWTENPAMALYFACMDRRTHGAILMLSPVELNRLAPRTPDRVLDIATDHSLLERYLDLGPVERGDEGTATVAVHPIHSSPRILLQKGTFTLHGDRVFGLNTDQAPSLTCLPILKNNKDNLANELAGLGVDEMSIFPEPEHLCSHLIRRAGLEA